MLKELRELKIKCYAPRPEPFFREKNHRNCSICGTVLVYTDYLLTDNTGCGITNEMKEALWDKANSAGMRVVQSVTKNLAFLCKGDTPGPSKLKKAEKQNVVILNEQEFLLLLETGEIPCQAN